MLERIRVSGWVSALMLLLSLLLIYCCDILRLCGASFQFEVLQLPESRYAYTRWMSGWVGARSVKFLCVPVPRPPSLTRLTHTVPRTSPAPLLPA